MPQVYVPLNTDGLDDASTGLPVHGYLVQGGFGTSSSDIGDLGTDAWTYADADENGQPYAYSLDTRVDVSMVIDDADNHIKRIEVVRPRGNTVVFDFAWDAANNEFSPIGYPTGIDASRLYVLRALDSTDNTSLSYEMLFPSGIVQTFNGGLISVSDANSGLSQTVGGHLGTDQVPGDAGLGDPVVLDSSRYQMKFNWDDGRISSVDYKTDPTKLNTSASAQTIETTIGYEGNGSY
jgi:hypothetical protein